MCRPRRMSRFIARQLAATAARACVPPPPPLPRTRAAGGAVRTNLGAIQRHLSGDGPLWRVSHPRVECPGCECLPVVTLPGEGRCHWQGGNQLYPNHLNPPDLLN